MLSYKHTVVSLLVIVLVACGAAAIVEPPTAPPAPLPVSVPEPVVQPVPVDTPAESLYIYNPAEGSVLIDFELGNESGMHLNGRDAFLSIGRNVSNQDNDPRIQFFTGARAPGDYTRSDDWDMALVGVGHSYDGKQNGHLRLNGSTFMIRGPGHRYTATPGAHGSGNGGRWLVFQSCDDPACDDDTDRSSFVGHLEAGNLVFGTVQDKYEPGTNPSLNHVVMRMTGVGLFPATPSGELADNRGSLGSADYRWGAIYGVNVYSGDLRFENNLSLTEHYYLGADLPPGLGLVSDRGETSRLLAFFGDDGTIWANDVRTLDELHTIYTIAVESPEDRGVCDFPGGQCRVDDGAE